MKNTTNNSDESGSTPWRLIALSGAFILAGVVLDSLCARKGHKHTESMLDEALDGTFPASDATATQDFSAPEDRTTLNS